MESLAIKETAQPEPSNVIDISANLLLCWVEDSKELASKQSNKSLKKFAVYAASMVLVTTLGYMTFESQTDLEAIAKEQSDVTKKLKNLGISSNSEKEKGGEVSVIQELVKAYEQANTDLVLVLGHSLSQTKGQMALKSTKVESSKTGILVSGTASVLDVRTMRVYLDDVQSAMPGTEGLMTSINTGTSGQEKGLQVAFEISKLTNYNFSPAFKGATMGSEMPRGMGNELPPQKGN